MSRLILCILAFSQLSVGQGFWAMHILDKYFTGAANKNLGNDVCVVGFITNYAFGVNPISSAVNSEMHIENTVIENVWIQPIQWASGDGRYVSCCPPGSTANPGNYYRCNTWTGDDNDNCHTANLPYNDGQVQGVGARGYNNNAIWMFSFPAEGEGGTWTQGVTRRVLSTTLAQAWVDAAGGCPNCHSSMENPCWGSCVLTLGYQKLIQIADNVLGDNVNYPDYPIPDTLEIKFMGGGNPGLSCVDLSGGNSAYGTAIDLWQCNGLVSQMWYFGNDGSIQLGGANVPGKCLDVAETSTGPENGSELQLWGCNGHNNQVWKLVQAFPRRMAKKREYFHIRLVNTNYCLDVPGNNGENGNRLWIWECNGGASQLWQTQNPKAAAHYDKQQMKATPWMGSVLRGLSNLSSNATVNRTWPSWQETLKDWYAAQMPTKPVRPLVPHGWKGYNLRADNVIMV